MKPGDWIIHNVHAPAVQVREVDGETLVYSLNPLANPVPLLRTSAAGVLSIHATCEDAENWRQEWRALISERVNRALAAQGEAGEGRG